MPDSKKIAKWIEYAKNDVLVANDLKLQKEYVHRAVLTHCQQGVEKYLKAFLLINDKGIIKTHDLTILNSLCIEIDKDFLKFNADFAWLSAVYIESRYPDDFEDIDKNDAEKALEITNELEKFILTKFK